MSGPERSETQHELPPRTRSSSLLFDLDFSFPRQGTPPGDHCQNRDRLNSACLLCSWMSAEFPKLMAKLRMTEIELKERRNAETRRNLLSDMITQEAEMISSSPRSSNRRSSNAEAVIELIKVKEDLFCAETRAVTLEREGLVLREEINRLKLQRSQLIDEDTLIIPTPSRKLAISSAAICQVVYPEEVDPKNAKGGLTRRVKDLINEEYIEMSELLQKKLADQVAKVHDKLKRAQRVVVKASARASYIRYFQRWRHRMVERKCAKRQKELRVKLLNAEERRLQLRMFSLWNRESLKRKQQFLCQKGCTIRELRVELTNAKERHLQQRIFSLWNRESLKRKQQFLCQKGSTIRKCFVKWATFISIEKNKSMFKTQDYFRSWKTVVALQTNYRKFVAYEMMRLSYSTNAEMTRRLVLSRYVRAWRTLTGNSNRDRSCKLQLALRSQYSARTRNSLKKWQLYNLQMKMDLAKSVLQEQVKSCEERICKIQTRQKRNTEVIAFARANNLKELETVARQASKQIQYKDAAHEREITKILREMEERTSSYCQRLSDNQSDHARALKVAIFRIWAAFSNKIARVKRARSMALEKHIINVEEISVMRTHIVVFMIWGRWKNLLYKKTRRKLETADLKLAGKLPTPIHKLFKGFLNDCHSRKICVQSHSQPITPSTSAASET